MPQAVTSRPLGTKKRVLTQINFGFVVQKRHWERFSPPKHFGSPCATNRRVACSIPDAVNGNFSWA